MKTFPINGTIHKTMFIFFIFQLQDIIKFGVDKLLQDASGDTGTNDLDLISFLGKSKNGHWVETAANGSSNGLDNVIVSLKIFLSFLFSYSYLIPNHLPMCQKNISLGTFKNVNKMCLNK